jgi:hypothetical protein
MYIYSIKYCAFGCKGTHFLEKTVNNLLIFMVFLHNSILIANFAPQIREISTNNIKIHCNEKNISTTQSPPREQAWFP